MKRVRIIFALIIAVLVLGCNSTKKMNKTDLLSRGRLKTTLDTAVMILPIEAKVSDIQKFIETTFEEFAIGKPEDELYIEARLIPGVVIDVDSDSLSFTIPMDVDITQKTFLGSVEANGSILLHLKSRYEIDEQWTFTTATRLVDYSWIKSPKANVSVISLSIESLSNRLIEKNKTLMVKNIDDQIKSTVNLKKSINDIWYRLRAPMEVSEEYKVWMQMKPLSLSVSRLDRSDDKVMVYIKARTSPNISVGERPVDFELDSIPKFEWLANDTTGYLIPLKLSIPDKEIQDIANAVLTKEVFDLGKKEVKVRDITISRDDDKWLVDLEVYGDITGAIQMKGRPVYMAKNEKIDLTNFEYEVDSRNVLLKSSALLFKQKVQRKLVDQLNILVAERKKEVLQSIDDQLLKTNQNQWLDLNNKIDRFTIYDLGVDDIGMWMYVVLSGEASAKFKYQAAVK